MCRTSHSSFTYLLLFILLITPACRKESEQDKVRKVITQAQHAAEDKKIVSFLELVSKTYQDPQGNDYDGIKGLLAFYFFRHQKVAVYIPTVDVLVSGPTATAAFQAVLTGRGTGESAAAAVLPEALGVYNFEVQLKKEKDAWKVISARWERAGEGAGQQQDAGPR